MAFWLILGAVVLVTMMAPIHLAAAVLARIAGAIFGRSEK